jgi:hypothetical protein
MNVKEVFGHRKTIAVGLFFAMVLCTNLGTPVNALWNSWTWWRWNGAWNSQTSEVNPMIYSNWSNWSTSTYTNPAANDWNSRTTHINIHTYDGGQQSKTFIYSTNQPSQTWLGATISNSYENTSPYKHPLTMDITLNDPRMSELSTNSRRQSVICHEFGHAVCCMGEVGEVSVMHQDPNWRASNGCLAPVTMDISTVNSIF